MFNWMAKITMSLISIVVHYRSHCLPPQLCPPTFKLIPKAPSHTTGHSQEVNIKGIHNTSSPLETSPLYTFFRNSEKSNVITESHTFLYLRLSIARHHSLLILFTNTTKTMKYNQATQICGGMNEI